MKFVFARWKVKNKKPKLKDKVIKKQMDKNGCDDWWDWPLEPFVEGQHSLARTSRVKCNEDEEQEEFCLN